MIDFFESDALFDSAEELYKVTPTRTKKVHVRVCGVVATLVITVCSNSYSMENKNLPLRGEDVEYVVERQSSLMITGYDFPVFTVLSEYDQARDAIFEIASLKDNWDGYQASAPSKTVIANSKKFISALEKGNMVCCDYDNVEATPYGTVVFNINTDMGLVSVEVGETMMGFFTDLNDGHNYASEGIETDFCEVPQQISVLLS